MKLLHLALALISGSLLAAGATAQPLGAGHASLDANPAACPTACATSNGPAVAALAAKPGPAFGKKHAKDACGKVWVPGRWEYHRERVFVPARTERVWCPPEYAYEYQCGKLVKVLVHAGHWKVVVVEPARYETKRCKHWVPGHWK